jgi:hypothetical protein
VQLYEVDATDDSQLFGGPEGGFGGLRHRRHVLGALRVDGGMLVVLVFTDDTSDDALAPAHDLWRTVDLTPSV